MTCLGVARYGLLTACLLGAGTARAGNYAFTTILLPFGASAPTAIAINRAGQVTGSYIDGSRQQRGYLWSAGAAISFTGPDPAADTWVGGLNGRGVVAGSFAVGGARASAFVRAPSGHERRLAVPRAFSLTITGINNGGQAIGYGAPIHHPEARISFLTDHGAVQLIGPHGAYASQAEAINGAGSIAGVFTDPADRLNKGFVYRAGVYHIFKAPHGFFEQVAINGAGVVAGSYIAARTYVLHGFTYAGGVFTTIDYPGATQTLVTQTLPDGTVIGTWRDGNFGAHGFVLTGGGFHSIDVPGAPTTTVTAVNADGAIAGTFQDSQGATHLFVGLCAAAQAPCTE